MDTTFQIGFNDTLEQYLSSLEPESNPCLFYACSNCTEPHLSKEKLRDAIVLGDQNEIVNTYLFSCLSFALHFEDDGRTAVTLALHRNREAIAQMLIDYGADVHVADRQGSRWKPIHYAVQNNHLDVLHLLLRCGIC